MSAFDELDRTVALKGKADFHVLSTHNTQENVCRGTRDPHVNECLSFLLHILPKGKEPVRIASLKMFTESTD